MNFGSALKIIDPDNNQVYLEDLEWCNGQASIYTRAECMHGTALVHAGSTCGGVSTPPCP